MKEKLEHIFDFCASIESDKEFEELTADDIREAIQSRLDDLGDLEILEAVGQVETIEVD